MWGHGGHRAGIPPWGAAGPRGHRDVGLVSHHSREWQRCGMWGTRGWRPTLGIDKDTRDIGDMELESHPGGVTGM